MLKKIFLVYGKNKKFNDKFYELKNKDKIMNKNDSQKFDLVMINMSTMSDWEAEIVNRNYFILKYLAIHQQIRQILAIDFFPMKIKTAIKHYWKNIINTKNTDTIYGDLTSICYQKTNKVTVYSTIDSIFSWSTVTKELNKIIERLKMQNIIIWSYNPMYIDYFNKIPAKMTVFDTVDNWLEHHEYLKLIKPVKLKDHYRIIAEKSDLIFTVSETLIDFYRQFGRQKNIYCINNGVDYDNFNDQTTEIKKTFFEDIKKPIIGYLGTITNDRIDFDLIEYLAKNNQDKIIVMAGPIWSDALKRINQLKKYPNIIFIGRIKWSEAPALFKCFNVAINPHKQNNFIKYTNSMKIYDYLAAGLPIVTTSNSGVEQFKQIISIANDYSTFNQEINRQINCNNQEKAAVRRATVRPFSWNKRVKDMMGFIKLEFAKKS